MSRVVPHGGSGCQRILDDPPLLEAIAAEVNRKYGAPLHADMAASGDAWFFALRLRL